jgi:hypothetical protein
MFNDPDFHNCGEVPASGIKAGQYNITWKI